MKSASAKMKVAAGAVAIAGFVAFVETRGGGDGIDWKYTVDDGEVSLGVGGWDGERAVPETSGGHLTIPRTIAGMRVTGIGDGAFYECASLTDISIPDGVTSIGNEAFADCASLERVSIPCSVTNIGEDAFMDCVSLASVTIPDGLTHVSREMFDDCSETLFDTKTVPGVVLVDGWALECEDDSLSGVLDLAGVRGIGVSAFFGCCELEGVKIPEGVRSIGDHAFDGCDGLASVSLPESVTSIGESAFAGCGGLTSLTIPDGVRSIGEDAFIGCDNLESISLPKDYAAKIKIGEDAFPEDCRLVERG